MLYNKPYQCTKCGTEWEDTWDCLCDDRCPECNTTMTVDESLCTELCTGCEEHSDTCPHKPDGLDEFECPNDACENCGTRKKGFMHNCNGSSNMPEIFGCPKCDDHCSFCEEGA